MAASAGTPDTEARGGSVLRTRQEVIAYLNTFKGPQGKCARLEQLRWLIDNGATEQRGGGSPKVATSGTSDPTASGAVAYSRQLAELRALEDEIGNVGELCGRVTHGDLLDNYYLTSGDVMWSQLAPEYDVDVRTMYNWRDQAVAELEWLL